VYVLEPVKDNSGNYFKIVNVKLIIQVIKWNKIKGYYTCKGKYDFI